MYEEVEMLKAGEGGFQGGGYVDSCCFLTFRTRLLARRRVLSAYNEEAITIPFLSPCDLMIDSASG
jgi:hypothetical protein